MTQFDPRLGRQVRADHQLVTQLHALGGNRGHLLVHEQKSWASITFSGKRHVLTLLFTGEDIAKGEELIERLPEHEFSVPGQLVADASVVRVTNNLKDRTLEIDCELLLLAED